jgi:hypothetical protein
MVEARNDMRYEPASPREHRRQRRAVNGMSECVWHAVPIGFFVFMLSMGVACSGGARRSRALLRYRCKDPDVLGQQPLSQTRQESTGILQQLLDGFTPRAGQSS